MAEAVLDASAVLALLRQEPGSEIVGAIIAGSLMSVINASEVLAKLIERGTVPADAEQVVASLPFAWVEFDRQQANVVGRMWLRGRAAGLSFGDRACLALAEATGLPAVTADTHWKLFQSTIEIRYIR